MSIVSDLTNPSERPSGARLYAALGQGRAMPSGPHISNGVRAEPPATVTLDKIGDFLELDFRRLFIWLRQGMIVIIALALIGGIGGGIFVLVSKPRYTVSTDILIDPVNLQILANDLYASPVQVDGQVMNAGSKLRVLTSRNVLARVVEEQNLADDREFYDPTPPFSLWGASSGGAADTLLSPELLAQRTLARNVTVTADEKSFVATLQVSAETTEKAIMLSDAMVRAFRAELAEGEAAGAARAVDAINDRLTELKSGVQAAEERVEAYKRENNLSASQGQLVNTQTMTQINVKVVDAQSRVIAAQSAYDTLVAAGPAAGTSGSAVSPSLAVMRDKLDMLRQQLDAQSMIFGPRHPTIVVLQAQVDASEAQLEAELTRVVNGARATLDEAKASLVALESSADKLTGEVFSDNASQVALRQLERDAASKTTIYESFLARAQQIAEREQIDTTNVRVISTAVPPQARSWPPRPVILVAAGGFVGLALGIMVAFALGVIGDMRRAPSKRDDAIVA